MPKFLIGSRLIKYRLDDKNNKILKCVRCNRDILIKPDQIGGLWYLNGYEDKKGKKHYGSYCLKCFAELKK